MANAKRVDIFISFYYTIPEKYAYIQSCDILFLNIPEIIPQLYCTSMPFSSYKISVIKSYVTAATVQHQWLDARLQYFYCNALEMPQVIDIHICNDTEIRAIYMGLDINI